MRSSQFPIAELYLPYAIPGVTGFAYVLTSGLPAGNAAPWILVALSSFLIWGLWLSYRSGHYQIGVFSFSRKVHPLGFLLSLAANTLSAIALFVWAIYA